MHKCSCGDRLSILQYIQACQVYWVGVAFSYKCEFSRADNSTFVVLAAARRYNVWNFNCCNKKTFRIEWKVWRRQHSIYFTILQHNLQNEIVYSPKYRMEFFECSNYNGICFIQEICIKLKGVISEKGKGDVPRFRVKFWSCALYHIDSDAKNRKRHCLQRHTKTTYKTAIIILQPTAE